MAPPPSHIGSSSPSLLASNDPGPHLQPHLTPLPSPFLSLLSASGLDPNPLVSAPCSPPSPRPFAPALPRPSQPRHLQELLALVAHLLPRSAALRSQVVAQVHRMDGGTSLLVKCGLPTNPVVDLPVQRAAVIQKGLGARPQSCQPSPGSPGALAHRGAALMGTGSPPQGGMAATALPGPSPSGLLCPASPTSPPGTELWR